MKEREQVLKHLSHDYYQAVRDPVWKNIFLSEPLLKLIDLQPFQKLNGIKQLGPTYLVYPGATHTRLSHSLGVFQIARRMIMHLLNKGGYTKLYPRWSQSLSLCRSTARSGALSLRSFT